MRGRAWLLFWLLLFCIAGILASLNGCGSANVSSSSGGPKIRHVVVIFQENRTPDNLFHGLPNADIAKSGLNSQGQTIALTPVPLANQYDLPHSHESFVNMYDGGKMDGADKNIVTCVPGSPPGCPPPNPQFVYVNPGDVAPYFQLAERYTFADHMFQTNQGPSFPAHQFIIAGTSAPTATSNLFAAENPRCPNCGVGWEAGCAGPSAETVEMIDPSGGSSTQFPCFEHPTLVDLLDSKGISWRYYTPSAGSIWTGPNAIHHLRFGPDWLQNVVLKPKQILMDIANGDLAAVSWVIPSGQASDHPGEQRRDRTLLGSFDRECHRQQSLLVEHRDFHHLG